MQTEKRKWSEGDGWKVLSKNQLSNDAGIVFVFGARELLGNAERYNELKSFYPKASILMGSTSGEICDSEVFDNTIIATAVYFEKTMLKTSLMNISNATDSFEAGKKLGSSLLSDDLVHIFVLSDGLKVNGSELVKGFKTALPLNVSVTGGLAGDAARFEKTLVGLDAVPSEGNIVAVGLYGKNIRVGYGSLGGWDYFGADRLVTRSRGNVLFELDGQSALGLYKKYLGDKAKDLPGSALLFPLGMKFNEDSETVVRTVLAVDENEQSMTFAGDIPQGSYVKLMKANFDKLIDGATGAAENSYETIGNSSPQLAILISCVGRKLVLDQRIEEEVEAVREVLGEGTEMTGFYSYGEISPILESVQCELHNQTMTITTISELV